MSQQALPPGQVARILHLALTLAPAVFAAMVVFVVRERPAPPAVDQTMQYLMVVVALLVVGGGFWLGTRTAGRRAGETEADYWKSTLPRAIMVWAALEAGALLMGVAGLLASEVTMPIAGLLIFLVLMTLLAPRRLAGE